MSNDKHLTKEFGTFIKQIRKEKRITLVELARKSGLSHSYLSQLENGKRNLPPISTQIKICRALDTSIFDVPIMEKHHYSFEELEQYQNEVEYEEIAEFIKVLSKDAVSFRDEVVEDPTFKSAIQNYLDEVDYPDDIITPSGLLEDMAKSSKDNDTWMYLNIVKNQLADLAERFSKVPKSVNTVDILDLMKKNDIKFNGHPLSTEEKERIVSMIKLMFPDKVDKG